MGRLQTLTDRVSGIIERALINTNTYGAGKPFASWREWTGRTISGSSYRVVDNATAYRCVDTIASNGAALTLTAVDPEGASVEHPFLELWNKAPNPSMSARVMAQNLWWRLETRGEWFAYLDRGESGEGDIVGIWPLTTMDVEILVDGTADRPWESTLIGYRVTNAEGAKVGLLPTEVLFVHYPDPDDPWKPLPPLRAAASALGMDEFARSYQSGQFVNADRPSGVLYLGDVDRETHEAIDASMQARHTGAANQGRTLILSGPVPSKYDRYGMTQEEIGYLQTRQANSDEILMAFGVPKDYLSGGATYENRAASRVTLWSDTIRPKADLIASEIDRQVFPDVDIVALFDFTSVSALQESRDTITSRTQVLVQNDVLTLDEARAAQGYDPLPDGFGSLTLTPYRSMFATPPANQERAIGTSPFVFRADDGREWRSDYRATRTQSPIDSQIDAGHTVAMEVARLQRESALAVLNGSTRAISDDLLVDAARIAQEQFEPWIRKCVVDSAVHYGQELDVSLTDEQIDVMVTGRMSTLVSSTTATTRDELDAALAKILDERATVADAAKQAIDKVFDWSESGNDRASTISVTEAHGALSDAGWDAAMQAASPGQILLKEWRTMRDSKVRETHAMQHGDRQHLSGLFFNGLSRPHDPNGPLGEIINCRCWLEYTVQEDNE